MHTTNGQEDGLAELVATKQFKQALNVCEKKLKKSRADDCLLVSLLLLEDATTLALKYGSSGKEDHHTDSLARQPPTQTRN